ncbi:MAG: hypothetical protein ACOX8N_07190, partial [Christensenellales bacterium]
QQLSFACFGSEIPPPVLEGAFRPKCNRSFDNVEDFFKNGLHFEKMGNIIWVIGVRTSDILNYLITTGIFKINSCIGI